ncbi:TPR-like protein [Pholiota conissans]|uniref:TPR-like protein n=1 Tax=Pholiota conissans TaxID=109636 RepID=A0A9P6D3W5_9AGAR|nr:TPR-like protein [Pholiota conissans]
MTANRRNNQDPTSVVDPGITLVNDVASIVKEVGEVLTNIPYVKSLSGVILQIIRIRNEVKANKERCKEVIDKALRMSKSIYEKLGEVAQSSQRERLSALEKHLKEHESILVSIYAALDKHNSRSGFSRILHRELDQLNQFDRRLDELNNDQTGWVVFHSLMRQVSTPIPRQLVSSISPSVGSEDHVLPPKPYLMIEREKYLNCALSILLGPSPQPSRIVILGGGGFGKTTLATSILHEPKIVEFYQLRYFLSCEAISNVETLLLKVSGLLNIQASQLSVHTVIALVRRKLQGSTALLCLDNFETLWEPPATRTAVEEVLAFIADTPTLSLIITTRGNERPARVVWSNPLLEPLSTLSLESAIRVLQEIAGIDAIDEDTMNLLKAIEGIPLAVTLVSNLLRDGQKPQLLWRQWSKIRTQAIKRNGTDDRHSSLDTSIALSVQCPRMEKDAQAKALLVSLSLLPDGFPFDDGSITLLEKHLKIMDIGTPLETLRAVALVQIDNSSRIHMLDSIRFFCSNNPSLKAIYTSAIRDITNYYIDLLAQAKDQVDHPISYIRIVPEIHNIHSVFQTSYGDKQRYCDAASLAKATCSLSVWSRYVGYLSKDTVQQASEATKHLPLLHAHCLTSLGQLYFWDEDFIEAERLYRLAASICRKKNSLDGELNASEALCAVLIRIGNLNEAEQTLKRSRDIHTKKNDLHGAANTNFNLGQLYLKKKQYDDTKKSFIEALDAYRSTDNLLGETNSCKSLANLYLEEEFDDLVTAEKFAHQALRSAQLAQYALGEGHALHTLGRLCLMDDRVPEAREHIAKAREVFEAVKFTSGELAAVNLLSCIDIQQDRIDDAKERLSKYTDKPSALSNLGWAYVRENQLDSARSALEKTLQLFRDSGDTEGQADVLAELAIVYFKNGEVAEAERKLLHIPEFGIHIGIEMRRLCTLGEVYIQQKRFAEAKQTLDSALKFSKRSHSSYQQGNVLRNMGMLYLEQKEVGAALVKFREALLFHQKAQWISEQITDLKRLAEAYSVQGLSEEEKNAIDEASNLTRKLSSRIKDL